MTILVIGGAGYIGTHVVQALLTKTDRRIAILDDFSSGSFSNLEQLKNNHSVDRLIIEVGNATDEIHLQEICERHNVTIVVECAAQSKAEISISVRKLARTLPIKTVVMVSYAGVYDPGTLVADERSPTSPHPDVADFLEAEQNYEILAKDGMVRAVALRLANVVGAVYAADLNGDVKALREAATAKEPFWLRQDPGPSNYIHITDAADIITEAALSSKYRKIVNVGTSLTMTEAQFAKLWMRVTGKFVDILSPDRGPHEQTLAFDALTRAHGSVPELSSSDVWLALEQQEQMVLNSK
jgi:nucleoside-diphosphate-sugar epimerase